MATSPPVKSTLEGLPKQFVSSLRVLFNILDEEKTGYVKVSDIESRWEGNDVAGLPSGVLDALRKVTPPDGKVSFERFVGGLKIALLRLQYDDAHDSGVNSTVFSNSGLSDKSKTSAQLNVPQNVQKTSTQSLLQGQKSGTAISGPNMATVRPNNAIAQRSQSKSMPHLAREDNTRTFNNFQHPEPMDQTHQHQRTSSLTSGSETRSKPQQEWRREQFHPTSKSSQSQTRSQSVSGAIQSLFANRRPGDGRSSVASTSALDTYGAHRQFGGSKEAELLVGGQKSLRAKREDPRRHTVSNGIDYNMIKRMKQLEQEKDVLLQGLEAVERAKEWYHQQIRAVQDKQKHMGRGASPNEYSLDSYQEKINLKTTWILQANQQLKTLIESSEKGLPLHMNLAVSRSPEKHAPVARPNATHNSLQERDELINRLRSQNKSLSHELGQKADRIEQLEHEKAQIVKELFAKHGNANNFEYDDTTFI